MGKMIIVDPVKCNGCHSCVVVCSSTNESIVNFDKSRIKVTPVWMEASFVPSVCLQCESPHCVKVCLQGALAKNSETGVVELNKDKCTGCKMCLVACPFGNITMVGKTAAKCETCKGDPACVKVCRWEALKYGEADELGMDRRRDMAAKVLECQREIVNQAHITS